MSRVRPAGRHTRSGRLLKGPYTPPGPKWCRLLVVRTALHMVLWVTVLLLVIARAWDQLLALIVMLAFGGLGILGYRILGADADAADAAPLVAPEPGEWAA